MFNKYRLMFISVVCITGCGGNNGATNDAVIRDYQALFSPLPTQPIYPADNLYSLEKMKLGEMLFWDPILSGDQNVACASCHHPDLGWADGRQQSVGSDGVGLGASRNGNQITNLNSPTILNTAFTGLTVDQSPDDFTSGGYFWDLRAQTLEEQSLGPIKNPIEMTGYHISAEEVLDVVANRLNEIPEYVAMFKAAFDENVIIDAQSISKAIATFERQIISPNTRFDLFLSGDLSALTTNEIVGLNRFIDVGCSRCHNGPMLSDNQIHNNEFVIESGDAVRTPTLRNLTFTAPFMQDGSMATITDAISIYENRDDLQVTLNDNDVAVIDAFLRTLSSSDFYREIPTSVPSGLPVGGDIQ